MNTEHMCSRECGCGTWPDRRRPVQANTGGRRSRPNLDTIEKNWDVDARDPYEQDCE